MADETGRSVYCADCSVELEESTEVKSADRGPCPNCGSIKRRIEITFTSPLGVGASGMANLTIRASGQGQFVPVGTASEKEVAHTVDAVISPPTERLERFEVRYERTTDDGAFLIYEVAGTEQAIPFYVGPGDDPDSAAMAVAFEFLKDIRPPGEANGGDSTDDQ